STGAQTTLPGKYPAWPACAAADPRRPAVFSMAAGPDRNAADASPVRRHPRWRTGSPGPRRASPGHGWSAPVADRAEHVWLLRPADAESAAHAVRCAGPASIPASKSAPAAGHADAASVAAWYPPCAGTPWTHFHLNSPTVPDTA